MGETTPYSSPVPVALYPILALIFMLTGIVGALYFFLYETTSSVSARKNLFKEILISLVSSVLLGFGTLFLLLWVGVYV